MQSDGPCSQLPLQAACELAARDCCGLRRDDLSGRTSLGEILISLRTFDYIFRFVSFLLVCIVRLAPFVFNKAAPVKKKSNLQRFEHSCSPEKRHDCKSVPVFNRDKFCVTSHDQNFLTEIPLGQVRILPLN